MLCSCMYCSVEIVSMKTFYMFHGSPFRKQRQDTIDVSHYPTRYVYPGSLTAHGAAPWLGKNTPFLTNSCWLQFWPVPTCLEKPPESMHAMSGQKCLPSSTIMLTAQSTFPVQQQCSLGHPHVAAPSEDLWLHVLWLLFLIPLPLTCNP